MLTTVNWLERPSPHEFEFLGETQEGAPTQIGARSVEGGPKSAASPKELVAMGIASCTGIDVVSTLKKMRQPLESLKISTELSQSDSHPRVFTKCILTYKVDGKDLVADRVVHAVELSFSKYCGVSAMIERSGCVFFPTLILNGIKHPLLAERENSKAERFKVGILATGNEVLLGKITDTNGGFIAKKFESIGVEVMCKVTCGDNEQDILRSLRYLSEICDSVIMTGGLGPTSDDLTASSVAKFFEVPCEFNQKAWDICVRAFQRLGRTEIPETNRKQAMLPQDCHVLNNGVGTAAGFRVSSIRNAKQFSVYALPGVPSEMEAMLNESVLPEFKSQNASFVSRAWQIFLMGESKLQATVNELERELKNKFPDAHVSYQAQSVSVTYSVNLKIADKEVEKSFSNYLESTFSTQLKTLLGHHLLYSCSTPLVDYVQVRFTETKNTLALAESCTGGLVSKEVSSRPGISDYFLGSVVSYSNFAKTRFLKVHENSIQNKGAVSKEVAQQMAEGAQREFGASVGVGITGIAGPTGGSESKPVGLVVFGISVKRDAIENLDSLTSKFADFRFERVFSDNGLCTFVCEQKFGSTTRENIQARSSQFVFGMLAILTSELRCVAKN